MTSSRPDKDSPAHQSVVPPHVLLVADPRGDYTPTLQQLAVQLDGQLLPDPHALQHWLNNHAGNLWLIAAGYSCQDALALARRHAERCFGAMLLIPQGTPANASTLPFPSVTLYSRPDARTPRLTASVTLATLWGSRLEALPADDDRAPLLSLLEIFQRLRQQNEGWPLGQL